MATLRTSADGSTKIKRWRAAAAIHGTVAERVAHGMVLAGLGIVAGLAGAVAATRLMRDLLFGVTATDPFTFALAAAALGVASLVAAYVPAWRASRVEPISALRTE